MVIIKICIFGFIVVSVKIMFILFFQEEDIKLYKMKETINFVDYLRIYSCTMKMSLNDILEKYNFKYTNVKRVFKHLLLELQNEEKSIDNLYEYEDYIKKELNSPKEFNEIITQISEYYGVSLSDVLNKKLLYTKNELEKFLKGYENTYKERKSLLNKLSLLVGCLIAIVLL
ncbi:hypothetical protein JYG23_05080 [Sedimentibacter sp. zth1]|uniref:hypothetical protein n=1 Tax=Sedimentibacter sp. zth1 TaxID=2816908 RepID=UPI001A91672F|nr:hypothetical protein [Sedimentibacter sp. zth1]QSX06825.1 hypothetical protein JYG23_05080 [Sedimentibacter sp. zth1]